jgi:TolB-like protein/Tfp pilus assembly protein PilF
MTDPADRPPAPQPPAPFKKGKKDGVKNVWISFVGRIVAQIIGAIASVVLAIFVLRQYQQPAPPPAAPGAANPSEARPARVAPPRREGEVALAVLPLDNFSKEPDQGYFADGMTEAIIADLAQIGGLRVISRTSSMAYREHTKTVPQVADELGVDFIVEGSVMKVGDRVRVTAQLVDGRSDEHVWARSYDRTLRDVLGLQGEVAAAIAKEVKGALTPAQQGRLAERRPVDPVVYDLYLRGRQAWSLRTPTGFEAAARYFQQAIDKDPRFALAYAGLADTFMLTGSGAAVASQARPEAKAAALKAVELDPSLAEARTSLAGYLHRQEGRMDEADREFRRAIELNQGYPTAHQWYAILLAERGRHDEALLHGRRAVALDPLSGVMHQTLGLVSYYGRQFPQAVAAAGRALELNPGLALARSVRARALLAQGNAAGAIKASEDATGGELLSALGRAYLRAGDRARADAVRDRLLAEQPVPAAALSAWYVAAGDHTRALAMMERALAGGSRLAALNADPAFDPLRSDPRFADVARKAAGGTSR